MYKNYFSIYCKITIITYNIDKLKITIIIHNIDKLKITFILRKSYFHYEDMSLK